MTPPKPDDWLEQEGHHRDPLWCGGNCHGQAVSDDPCWGCIDWAFTQLEKSKKKSP